MSRRAILGPEKEIQHGFPVGLKLGLRNLHILHMLYIRYWSYLKFFNAINIFNKLGDRLLDDFQPAEALA